MSQSHEVDCRHGAESPPHEELLEAVAGAEALICTLDEKIDAEVIEAGRGLKVIGTMFVLSVNQEWKEESVNQLKLLECVKIRKSSRPTIVGRFLV